MSALNHKVTWTLWTLSQYFQSFSRRSLPFPDTLERGGSGDYCTRGLRECAGPSTFQMWQNKLRCASMNYEPTMFPSLAQFPHLLTTPAFTAHAAERKHPNHNIDSTKGALTNLRTVQAQATVFVPDGEVIVWPAALTPTSPTEQFCYCRKMLTGASAIHSTPFLPSIHRQAWSSEDL